MKSFGYPREDRGCISWSDRPMRIVGDKFFWGERDGQWWSENGDEFFDKETAMTLYLSDPEGTHRLMYDAHWELVRANEKVHAVIMAIHAVGRGAEARNESKESLLALERARDLIDEVLRIAGDARTKLITVTGCDGTCSNAAAK